MTSLVRWGRNGLACLKPDRVFIIESNLVGLP